MITVICERHAHQVFELHCVACESESRRVEIIQLQSEMQSLKNQHERELDAMRRERDSEAEKHARATEIIEKQKRIFKACMDRHATVMIDLGRVCQDQQKRLSGQPDLVDSERAANEILTNENDKMRSALRHCLAWFLSCDNEDEGIGPSSPSGMVKKIEGALKP